MKVYVVKDNEGYTFNGDIMDIFLTEESAERYKEKISAKDILHSTPPLEYSIEEWEVKK
jgi:hypothetical protein